MKWSLSHALRSVHHLIVSSLPHRFLALDADPDAGAGQAAPATGETGDGTDKLVEVRLDLAATAAGNTSTRCALSATILESDSGGTVRRFFDLVAQSAFSSNVSADKIETYDRVGRVLHSRDFHVHLAGGNETNGLADFAAQQGKWLIRREAFEDLWLDGRTFVYGAVNAGGMGTEGNFGPFCLVIGIGVDPDASSGSGIVFPSDSAQRYTTSTGGVEAGKAIREATEWSARGDLAVIERIAEITVVAESKWPDLVCTSERYFEVVRTGPVPTHSISEVRINRDFLQRLRILRARYIAGEDLTTPEQHEVAAYDSIRHWTRSSSTQIVEMA
jgi:hypothetical protein